MLITTDKDNIRISQKNFQELINIFLESLNIIKLELNEKKTKYSIHN